MVIALQVAVLGFVIWALTKQTRDGYLFTNEFDPLVLSVPNLVAGAVIGAGLTALAVRRPALDWPPRARALASRLRDSSAIPVGLAVAVTALWLLPAIVTETTIDQAGFIVAGHVHYVFEDYLAVVNGRTPLVDYIPDYASLLPLLAAPFLTVFDLSITSFSVIECLLSLGAMIALYAALSLVTRGRWSALALYLPLVAISFFPWTASGLARDFNGLYYAAFPNRYVGPFLVIWLCARHLRRGSPPIWVLFGVAGLTVLNNFEFGLASLAALVLALAVWIDRSDRAAPDLRTMIVEAIAGLAGAVVLVSAVTLIRAGELPDPGSLTYYSREFGRAGYGLLPMPKYGLHWALYFTYAGALVLGAVRRARGEPDRTLTALLIFAGVFGLTSGQYFAGRSVPSQLIVLFPVWGFAIALLAWAVFEAVRELSDGTAIPRRWLVPIFAVLATFGVMLSTVNRVPLPWQQVERLSDEGPASYELSNEEAFIERRTKPGEPVLIVATPLDFRVAERAGVRNVSPSVGGGGISSPAAVLRAKDNLTDEGGTKMFEKNNPLGLATYLPQIGFRKVETDPTTGIHEWVLVSDGES